MPARSRPWTPRCSTIRTTWCSISTRATVPGSGNAPSGPTTALACSHLSGRRRGTGGLVTALIGLANHRDVTWIASAMTEEDAAAAAQNNQKPFTVTAPGGTSGIIVDNTVGSGTLAGASQIYYTTRSNGTCATSGGICQT